MCVGVGLAVDDAAAVAVNLGPGAFTGLRVGLATAQGLATAYRKPLVGCSTFEALVDAAGEWDGLICPFIEARRGEVYAAFYRRREGQAYENHARHGGNAGRPVFSCTGNAPCFWVVAWRTMAVFWCQSLAGWRCVGTLAAILHWRQTSRVWAASVWPRAPRITVTVSPPIYIRAADARLPRHKASVVANR